MTAPPLPGTARYRAIPSKKFARMIEHHPLWARQELWRMRRKGASRAELERLSRNVRPESEEGPSVRETARKKSRKVRPKSEKAACECDHDWKDTGEVKGNGAPFQHCAKCDRVSVLWKSGRCILRKHGKDSLDKIKAYYAGIIRVGKTP